MAAWRISLAALVLFVVCHATGNRLSRSVADWREMLLIGSLNSALPFFLISWGIQYISSAEAALLMATGTFFSLILSHFVSPDERINASRFIGISVGFCGVFLLVVHELLETGMGGLKGQLAVIGAGVSYATSSVLSRRISHLPALPAAASILGCTSVYMLPLAFLLEDPLPAVADAISIGAILMLGIIATAVAYVIRLQIIVNNGAVFMAQVGYLVPLFGVIWSWLFLAETVSPQMTAALAAILCGIAITRRGT